MQVERRHLSPIENELLFSQWCQRREIKQFLLDGDDTIWATVEIFREFASECYKYLEENAASLTRDQWQASIQEVNDAMFKTHGVNPDRWGHVMAQVARENGLSNDVRDAATKILMKIYDKPPRFLDGAEEGLAFLEQSDIPFGVVTHANHDWTMRKYHWLKLSRFLPWDNVYMVDENGHKTGESWRQAMDYFHVSPDKCAVIGDSPRSDINPASQIGVRHCFLIENPTNERWALHNQPVDPTTRKIHSLSELIHLGEEYLTDQNPTF